MLPIVTRTKQVESCGEIDVSSMPLSTTDLQGGTTVQQTHLPSKAKDSDPEVLPNQNFCRKSVCQEDQKKSITNR